MQQKIPENPGPVTPTGRTRCEVWTRVMGYHRPVTAWNPGKQAEHAERCFYKVMDEPG